jgi:hypothetical protein
VVRTAIAMRGANACGAVKIKPGVYEIQAIPPCVCLMGRWSVSGEAPAFSAATAVSNLSAYSNSKISFEGKEGSSCDLFAQHSLF